ncbi:VOC family protein [Lysobacter sp. CA196]|uniref:VOC family protein n=1 Tax=Lysobacter sp. CA196 TaxID=3455606 RepID=UPI003F8D8245
MLRTIALQVQRLGMKLKRSKSATRTFVLWSALILGIVPSAAIAAESLGGTTEIDHALLWGRDIDQISAVMAVKLGFQVRPGRSTGGVANPYVRMADRSYLELFGILRADAELDPGMQADQASLRGGAGSRTFGLRSAILDQAHKFLQQQAFAPTPIFTAALTDPDGDGPTRPPRWRLFAFEPQPLSSHLFFIDYATLEASPGRASDARIAPRHPNSAQALTGLWLLSSDADADRKQFERMGLGGAKPVRIPQIAARGYCVPVGQKQVFALQPDGPGPAAEALRSGGEQVLGISMAVADIDVAKRRVERGYETELASYRGALGDAFLAPTQGDLGLLIEFHAASQAAACAGAAD